LTRHYYRQYGITLDVNEALPSGAPCAAQAADITVEVLPPGEVAEPGLAWVMPDPSAPVWRAWTDEGSWLRLRYSFREDWVEFVIDERGNEVWVARSPTVLIEEAAGLLFGPVLSCVLAQRGLTCLHAAVVALEDEVIALVGGSGAGKSTTALALVQHGGSLVADDVAVLAAHSGRITVAAGSPHLRMRPDSARWLLGSFESLEPTWSDRHPLPPKRYLAVETVDAADAITGEGGHTLDAVYVLGWSDANVEPSICPLAPGRALAKLMAHRHMMTVLEPTAHGRDFEVLAQLTETASVSELVRPAGLETTAQTIATIVSDVRSRA
jgi:hypothetical protein